jgi:hypothetical protein
MRSLRNLDLFRKVSTDHSLQTYRGGVITIVALSTMLWLFLSETNSFFQPTIRKESLVEQDSDNSFIRLNIDITLPYLPCHPLSLDQQNDVNSHILDSSEHLQKIRLSKQGSAIPGGFNRNLPDVTKAIDDEEGCRLRGYIEVGRVTGNFHISFHVAHDLIARLPRTYLPKLKFNHVINHLSLGSEDLTNLIESDFGAQDIMNYDGISAEDEFVPTKHEYFLKIIPVQFVNELNGKKINAFTYSLNHNRGRFHAPFGAIYFRYSFEDLTMRYTKVDKSIASLVVSLCAILGGIFTVLGLVNKVVN